MGWPDCAVEFEIFSPPREDMRFRLILLALVAGNLVASLSCEMFLADVLVTKLFRGKEKKHEEVIRAFQFDPTCPQLSWELGGLVQGEESERETRGEEDVKMEQVPQQSRITAFRSLL